MPIHKIAGTSWSWFMTALLILAVASASIINQTNSTDNSTITPKSYESNITNVSEEIIILNSEEIFDYTNYSNTTAENNATINETPEQAVENEKTIEVESPTIAYTEYDTPGKIFKISSRNIIIDHDSEAGEPILLFNITSTSDLHLLGDFEKAKEWAYEKKGYEVVESDNELVVIGDYVCIKHNYFIEDKGSLFQKKTYPDCVYYPPHYVDKSLEKDVELVRDDGTIDIVKAGTIVPQQVRSIEKLSDYSVKVSYEDDYDPTATELQVGMVSYWTLDTDESDDYGSNNGSNNGADHISAKIDDGYDFEASDTEDYITVSDDNSLDITDAISLSFWIEPESFSHAYIISKYRAYMCQMEDSSGNVQCGIWYDSGGPSWLPMVEYEVGSEWSHIVFTYDKDAGGSQEAKMYVNGTLVDTGDYSYSIYTGSYDLGMGNRLTDYARDYDGLIDEVGIWNRVLDSDDVTELYANGDGYQPFEESSTIWSREDICPSWTGNSGWNTAEFRAHIDSVSSSYDQVRFKFCAGTDEDLRILNLSVCYTTDSTPSTDETCSDFVTHEGDGATGDWRYIEISSGECEWSDWLDYDWQSGREHFLQWGTQSGSYDGNKYVSGCSSSRLSRLIDVVSHVMNPSWTSDSWESYMYDLDEIEGRTNESSFTVWFDNSTPSGSQSVDYVQVNVTVSEEASSFIDWNYSLISWLNFEDYSGSTVYDDSSYEIDGTLQDDASVADGFRGNGLELDGSSDYVTFPESANHNTTGELSVMAWVKPKSGPVGLGRLVANRFDYNSGDYLGWYLGDEYGSSDYFYFRVWNITAGCQPYQSDFFADNQDKWVHVAGVYNPGVSCQLYINGSLVSEDTTDIPLEIIPTNDVDLRIGARSDNSAEGNWNGTIDEVMVFSRALASGEIQAAMSASQYSRNFTSLSSGSYGFQAFAVSDQGDIASTELRTVTINSDSCTCPGLNQDWEIDMTDSCDITSNCDLGTGTLSFASAGDFTCAATISCASVEMMTVGQEVIITDDCVFDIS